MMSRITTMAGYSLFAVSACSSGSRASGVQSNGDFGDAVSLPQATVTTGFAQGRMRAEQAVEALKISKHPITVGQMKECVLAQACTKPTLSCANWDQGDEHAALCVGADNAKTYCEWVGGRLPNLAEWLYAARGPSVRRFPWGDAPPTCEHHPTGRPATDAPLTDPADPSGVSPCGLGPSRLLRVGEHAEGASPAGVEDLLLSYGELVSGQRGERFGACSNPERACLVYGLTAGSIDSVEPVAEPVEDEVEARLVRRPRLHTFRCVAAEEG